MLHFNIKRNVQIFHTAEKQHIAKFYSSKTPNFRVTFALNVNFSRVTFEQTLEWCYNPFRPISFLMQYRHNTTTIIAPF